MLLCGLMFGLAGCLPSQEQQAPEVQTVQGDYVEYPELKVFIAEMQQEHGFDQAWLEQVFSTVKRDDAVLAKMRKPAEGKVWHQYRPIFLTEMRIQAGAAFWQRHEALLSHAQQTYGVPAEYIVAIIGVETQYGRYFGKHDVLRALTTLAFDYLPRADFFRDELVQYLLLTREQQIAPYALKGSYAGAMGLGQFISSSYRNYALDFNGDGRTDLWHPADAIASVANYLAEHGWQRQQDVAVQVNVTGNRYAKMVKNNVEPPRFVLQELTQAGVQMRQHMPHMRSGRFDLLSLQVETGDEFWITGDNFYVITRYNRSPKYAMAVHQLAQAIQAYKNENGQVTEIK